MSDEFKKVDRLYKQLIKAPLIGFPAKRSELEAPTERGVYLIYSSKHGVLHVGQSVRGRNGLLQRLQNHFSGSSSFVRGYFDGDPSIIRKECSYKYIEIADARERALLESYLIGRLCPAHLGLGQKKNSN